MGQYKLLSDLPAHIEKDGKLFAAYFLVGQERYYYGRDFKAESLKERMRRQGYTQFIDEYKGQKAVKVMPKVKVVKGFRPKPKPEYVPLGKWKLEDHAQRYRAGQYMAEVYENDSGWFVHLLGTNVSLATYGRDGENMQGVKPKNYYGWDRMPEAMAFAVGLVDQLHRDYVPQKPNKFAVGDVVCASEHNWNFERGAMLTVEDVQDGIEIGGASSYRIYYAEGHWHRNMDVEEFAFG